MRWKKGESGNPKGKPAGIHSHHSTQVRELLAGRVPELVKRAIELALEGDTVAMKICLDRVCPPLRPRDDPVTLALPKDGSSLAILGRRIFTEMGAGALTPDQAVRLLQALQALSTVETAGQFEERLAALERQAGRDATL